MYTNYHFWRDMAILGASWAVAIWGILNYGDDTKNGGASGRW